MMIKRLLYLRNTFASLAVLLVLLVSGNGFGQTTVTYSFSQTGAASGINNPVNVDSNIDFSSFKNGGTSDPAINSGQLRLYQNNTKGGSIKITAKNGVTITQVVMNVATTGDGKGPRGYSVDNATEAGTFAQGTNPNTMNVNATNYVEYYSKGNSSSTRTYVNSFTVTYTLPGNTVTFNGNGATGGGSDNAGGSYTQTASGFANLIPNTFTKAGSIFAGWATTASGDADYEDEEEYEFTANTTLYAQWTPLGSTIVVTPSASLSLGTTICEGSRGTGFYTVTGSSLTADIELTPTANIEISTTSDFATSYNSTSVPKLKLTPSLGAVNQIIYVRSVTTLPAGAFTGSISHTSTDATTVTKNLTGTVIVKQTPTISIAQTSGATSPMCGSQSITFTATTANLGGGSATIQWKRNGSNVGTGGVTYTLTTPAHNDNITCEITNITNGCVTSTTAVSNSITLIVNEVPATPTGLQSNSPNCLPAGVIISSSSSAPEGITWYWQGTNSNGTATTNNQATYNAVASGTYYIRARNNTTGCWSASASIAVVVNSQISSVSSTPSPTNNNTSVCYSGDGAVNTISWSAASGATSYDVYFGAGSLPGTPTTNVTTTSYNVGTLLASTTYSWKIVPRNGCGETTGTPITWSFTTRADLCFCTASGGTSNSGILRVQFNTIDETTPSNVGYTDKTSDSTNVMQGAIHNLTVNVNTNGSYTSYIVGWIDWNQNGIFEVSERYQLGTVNSNTNGQQTLAITVPAGAMIGSTRMRISANTQNTINTYAGPCESFTHGEVEDYTINVVAACTSAPNPIGTIGGTFTACTTTSISYSGADAANAYWQTTATGTSTAEPAISPKTITLSGTYYVRIYNGSCWSAGIGGTVSEAVVINSPIAITTQPVDRSIITGANTTFSVVATNVTGYQWQVDTGSGFTNLTNGAPYSTVTTATLTITGATAAMSGYLYRCVLTAATGCSNSNTNGTATLVVTNVAPNNATLLKSCIANNQLTLRWTASTGTTPTGYIVFAQPSTTIPQMAVASAGNAASYSANTDYSLATEYTTLGKAVYKGNATTATITGLSNTGQYTFKVVAYIGETQTGWASAINNTNPSSSSIQTYTVDVPEISNLAASINPTTSTVSWNVVPDSVGCYEYMVVATAGAVAFTPTGDGSSYTAAASYTTANQVVYKGTGNSIIVTNLTLGVNYCYTVFVREINSSNQWSEGTSICQTTGINYCNSQGSTTDATGITRVQFNTINQTSTGANAYTNFTSVSTSIELGTTHVLSINVNTDEYQNYTRAWIDWNRDGDFSDSGESYDLGNAYGGLNELTSNSPLSITVPSTASLGTTRMRIATQYFFDESDIILTPCGTYTYGEVEDYTLTITQPANAEINIKGGTISIANGFDAPYALNNTLFASTALGVDSIEKEFTIENIGLANLNLTGTPIIKIEGANATDFIVTQQAVTPVINGVTTSFKIKFNPTVAGLRTATVRIENSDADENPYLFSIEGTGVCAVEPTVTVFPLSGPSGTVVAFTSGTNDLTGAAVTFNNVSVPIILNSASKIEVVVPANANDGNFNIQLATGCGKTQLFDVLDTDLSSCETAGGGETNASDLFIYEVYDENGGSGGVITLYNRTGNLVNLSGYSITRAGDYGGTYLTTSILSGTIAAEAVAVIGVSSSPCGYASTGNGSFSSGFNENDGFRLMNGTTIVDDVAAPNTIGYYLKRKNANLNPNTTFNSAEWTTQSIASGDCLTGVAIAPLIKTPPTVTVQPSYQVACGVANATLIVAGTEGVSGGLSLSYQWYVLGTTGTWSPLSNNSIYSGVTDSTLIISNTSGLADYQYYCQIRENSATCYTASNATVVRITEKTWNGAVWSGNGLAPTSSQKVVFESTYDSSVNGGSIETCVCEVKDNAVVVFKNGDYLKVENDLTVASTASLEFKNNSSLVQVNPDAINTGNIKMERNTTPMNKYDYTYWSSPVAGVTLNALSPDTHPNRYYSYNAVTGAWSVITGGFGSMSEGNGYIIRAPNNYLADSYQNFTGNFTGKTHNGLVTPTINGPDKWNLLGNPYPSAVDADLFLEENEANLGGTLYFWTHNSPFTSNGYAYSSGDYASWNGVGGTNTTAAENNGNGINTAPVGKIAAGQGFFVQGLVNGTAEFNNTMRIAGENSQFFRSTTSAEKHRIWLNLQGGTDGFSQTLVGYVTNATNGIDHRFDGTSFGGNSVTFYSVMENKNWTIQGRALPFTTADEVPLGYKTTLTGNLIISIDDKDGLLATQTIYLKDNLLNVVHNLTESPYTFASVPGTFDDRFVLRYLPGQDLDNPTFKDQIEGVTIRKNNADLYINSVYETIDAILIFDITGRLLFEKENCNTNSFKASHITQSEQTLIVKVRLNNGGVITKKVW